MKRRDFSAQLAVTAVGTPLIGTLVGSLAVGFAGPASAQGVPVEGQQYIKLAQPVPMASNGKINIVEFFWYGCPHCNAFEPYIEAWAKKLPPDVNFTRTHVTFTALHVTHAKIFYTLETMGLVEQMHKKVFAAIHVQHKRLDKEADIEAFMTENGVDGKKFMDVFKSFSVQTKVNQAKQLSEAYKIDGVPTIGIQGRYFTSVGLAGGPDQALAVTNFLAQKIRSGG